MIASTSKSALAPRSARVRSAVSTCTRRPATALNAIKVYTANGSRGKIAEWVLAELKVPFETVTLNMRAGEHKSPSYLAINPFGKLPAIVDGDTTMFESGAILLHFAHKYAKQTDAQRATAYQWTLFANSTMCDAFFGAGSSPSKMADVLGPVENILSKQAYFDGAEFGISDIAMGSYLLYLPLFYPDMFAAGGFPDKYPSTWKYMINIAQRETCPDSYKEGVVRAVEALAAAQKGGNPLANLFKGR